MLKRYGYSAIRHNRSFKTACISCSENTGATTPGSTPNHDSFKEGGAQQNASPPKFRAKRLSQETLNELRTLSARKNTSTTTTQTAKNPPQRPVIRFMQARSDKPTINPPGDNAPQASEGGGGAPQTQHIRTVQSAETRPPGALPRSLTFPSSSSGPSRQGGRQRGGRGRGERNNKRGNKVDDANKAGTISYTAAEELYFLEKEAKEKDQEMAHNPSEITLDSLIGTGPAIPLGEFGMRDTLTSRMVSVSRRRVGEFATEEHLARRLCDGEFVLFEDEEEKKRVVELVDEMNRQRAGRLSDRKGEVVEKEEAGFEVLDESARRSVVGTLLAGRYDGFDDEGAAEGKGEARLKHVGRMLTRNETYRTVDRDRLVGKVGSLMRSAETRLKRAELGG